MKQGVLILAILALVLPVAAQEVAEPTATPAEEVAECLKAQGRYDQAVALLAQPSEPQLAAAYSSTAPEMVRNPFIQYPDWITTGEYGGRTCDVYINQCYIWYSSPPVVYCRTCCVHYRSFDGQPYGQSIAGELIPVVCTDYF